MGAGGNRQVGGRHLERDTREGKSLVMSKVVNDTEIWSTKSVEFIKIANSLGKGGREKKRGIFTFPRENTTQVVLVNRKMKSDNTNFLFATLPHLTKTLHLEKRYKTIPQNVTLSSLQSLYVSFISMDVKISKFCLTLFT